MQQNFYIMEEFIEEYSVEMDSETVEQDFDDIDLYGEKMIDDEDDDCEVEFE